MRRGVLLLLALAGHVTPVPAAPASSGALAAGARDGDMAAWDITAVTPPGWNRDCCTYARAIGVNAVLYQGEWSGKPQRVMVLNVWPRKLATLDDEVRADLLRYRQLDPKGKVSRFAIRHPTMTCEASVYQGSDHIDDVLVFCDPGQSAGARLSWSMSLDDSDPGRRLLLDDFMRVVVASRYRVDASTAE